MHVSSISNAIQDPAQVSTSLQPPVPNRRPWSHAESALLMSLWDSLGSVHLLARALNRTVGSVMTQSSRMNLPARNVDRPGPRMPWRQ